MSWITQPGHSHQEWLALNTPEQFFLNKQQFSDVLYLVRRQKIYVRKVIL